MQTKHANQWRTCLVQVPGQLHGGLHLHVVLRRLCPNEAWLLVLVVGLVGTQTKYKLILFQVGSQYGPGLEGSLRHWQQAAVGLCRTATNSQWKPSLCAGPGFKSPRTRTGVRVPATRSGSCQTVPSVRRGRSVELGFRCGGAEAHISAVKCPGHCTTVQAGPPSSAGEPRAGQSVKSPSIIVNSNLGHSCFLSVTGLAGK